MIVRLGAMTWTVTVSKDYIDMSLFLMLWCSSLFITDGLIITKSPTHTHKITHPHTHRKQMCGVSLGTPDPKDKLADLLEP